MLKNFTFSFLYLILAVGCMKQDPEINAVCERRFNGTYLIKWETFPPMEGTVKVYESTRPDSFNLASPIFEQTIQSGFGNVLSSSMARTYFKLVFNRKYSTIVAERNLAMQDIYNFRELGGYYNKEHKQIRWGKIFRSGSLDRSTAYDQRKLSELKLKTLIDLRSEQESYVYPYRFKTPQVYNLPLRGNTHDIFFNEVLAGKLQRKDVLDYDNKVFLFMLENNTDYWIRMFDLLLDEKNYPVIITCFLGKDRSAIASALILAALNVDEETILEDYLLSNALINYRRLASDAESYSFDIQLTITALYRVHPETIRHAFELIQTNYGSVQNYLEKELLLTSKKREKLKSILLN